MPLNDSLYHTIASRLSRCLYSLNLPLETEFPIFKAQNVGAEKARTFAKRLEKLTDSNLIHRPNIVEAYSLGLMRCSMDFGFDAKIHFFMDFAKEEIIAVPMFLGSGPTTAIDRFILSIQVGNSIFPLLEDVGRFEFSLIDNKLWMDSEQDKIKAALSGIYI